MQASKLAQYFEYPVLAKAEGTMQPDKGVHQSYKDVASKSANLMYKVKVKEFKTLDKGIPLHVTIKTFDKPDELPFDEIKEQVKQLKSAKPDVSSLEFKPIMFTSPKTGNTYYMIKIMNFPNELKKLTEHFKDQGITHEQYMPHITVNKEIYDKVVEEGLEPEEVEFSSLLIEKGPGNTFHVFGEDLSKSEPEMDSLQKASIKQAIAGLATAGMMATAVPTGTAAIDHQPKAGSHEIEQTQHLEKPQYDRQHMLRAIASVESSGGTNTDHKPMGGMHRGETAFGKYGLTPITIRETIKLNRELSSKHQKALLLEGSDLKNYVSDNPGLEDQIAEKHLARLEHHFGQDPSKLGYAWLNGVTGTYKAKKNKKNFDDHWHAKKVSEAYSTLAKPVKQASN